MAMRPSDSASTFSAQGAMALAGMVAWAGRNWCRRSVTSCATPAPATESAATAPSRMDFSFIFLSLCSARVAPDFSWTFRSTEQPDKGQGYGRKDHENDGARDVAGDERQHGAIGLRQRNIARHGVDDEQVHPHRRRDEADFDHDEHKDAEPGSELV